MNDIQHKLSCFSRWYALDTLIPDKSGKKTRVVIVAAAKKKK